MLKLLHAVCGVLQYRQPFNPSHQRKDLQQRKTAKILVALNTVSMGCEASDFLFNGSLTGHIHSGQVFEPMGIAPVFTKQLRRLLP